MEEKDLTQIAPVSKRALSFIIDFVLAFVLGIIINSTLTSTYLFNALGGGSLQQDYYSFAFDSGLVNATKNDDGTIKTIFLYSYAPDGKENTTLQYVATPNLELGYEAYLDKVWNYYTDFYPNDSRMTHPEGYTYSKDSLDSYKTYVYKDIFLLPNPTSVEGKSDVTLYSSDENQIYFQYATNEDGTPNLTAKPILRENVKNDLEDATKRSDTLKNLRDYFLAISESSSSISISGTGIYYQAALHMEGQSGSNQTYFSNIYTQVSWISWECSLVALLPLYVILFYIVPACDKKGRTLGKWAFGVVVINKDGTYMKPYQRFIRPLYMVILCSLTLIPNNSISFLAFGAVALLDFGFASFGKNSQSLHDKIFGTLVVTKKKSTIFKTKGEKEEYLAKENQRIEEEKSIKVPSTGKNLDLSTLIDDNSKEKKEDN